MKIAQWNYLGPRSTPQEVRDLRAASFDFHRTMGTPVIHKHKWNLKDVREGRAQICPYHDVTLQEDTTWDPYCFGTGILGGWADGVVTFITIADTQEDRIRIGPEGVLLMETHPGFTAPWVPEMGDEDLLITGQFDTENWNLLHEETRYELQEITPRTMRGFRKHKTGFRVHQQGNLDKLPYGHRYYDVPVIFDYHNLPPVPVVPPGGDPDDYPVPVGAMRTGFEIGVVVAGDPALTSAAEYEVKVTGIGSISSLAQDVRVVGDVQGTHIIFE